MKDKVRSGLSTVTALGICGHKDIEFNNFVNLRKLIDSAVNILGVDICESVFSLMIRNGIVGDRLWCVFTKHCDNELGIFARMIELVYTQSFRDIDYLLNTYGDLFGMVCEMAIAAKTPYKPKTSEELIDEILRIV